MIQELVYKHFAMMKDNKVLITLVTFPGHFPKLVCSLYYELFYCLFGFNLFIYVCVLFIFVFVLFSLILFWISWGKWQIEMKYFLFDVCVLFWFVLFIFIFICLFC